MRRADRRHRRPPPHRRSTHGRDAVAEEAAESVRNFVRRRRHDGPGRGPLRRRVPQEALTHRRGAHQDGRRRPRWRGPFHPDRIVSRILGMGDILSLIERAEQQIDKKKAEEMATKALTGDGFSLEDFRDQLRQVKKMGSMKSLIGMLPSIGPFSGLQKAADNVDEKQINRVEAIISSMTMHERNHHEVINGSRRKRIARGSGTSVQEVNNLLRQYAQMRKMFKQIGKASFARKLAGMKLPGM